MQGKRDDHVEQDNCISYGNDPPSKGGKGARRRPRCCRGRTRFSSWIRPFMVAATAGNLQKFQKSKNSQKCNQKYGVLLLPLSLCGSVSPSLCHSLSLSLSVGFSILLLLLPPAAAAAGPPPLPPPAVVASVLSGDFYGPPFFLRFISYDGDWVPN